MSCLLCAVYCSQRSATLISILPLPQEQSSRLFERHTAQYGHLSMSLLICVLQDAKYLENWV